MLLENKVAAVYGAGGPVGAGVSEVFRSRGRLRRCASYMARRGAMTATEVNLTGGAVVD